MPRAPRDDHPGCWIHATNRGIAKRPIFGGRPDVRHFLAGLAREVRAGTIEVHGFSILTDHFHLLLRSLRGEISDVMRRVQNRYARYFNRRLRRDGPLFRGRFWSRAVSTSLDWERVLRYIDRNPVAAGLALRSEDYPYGSAFLFARGKAPPWLEDSLVRAVVTYVIGTGEPDGPSYLRVFGRPLTAFEEEYLKARLQPGRSQRSEELVDLIGAAPTRMLEWMRRKSHLADGKEPRALLVSARTLEDLVGAEAAGGGTPDVGEGLAPEAIREALLSGLLTTAGGLGRVEVAVRLGISAATVHRRNVLHKELLDRSEAYAIRAAEIVAAAIRIDHPAGAVPPELLDLRV